MIYDKLFQEVIEKVSIEKGLPKEVVLVAYRSYWEFIKKTIQELNLKEDITEEEFNQLRTNFNIPSIGKLYITWDKLINVKKRRLYLQKIKEEKYDSTEKN